MIKMVRRTYKIGSKLLDIVVLISSMASIIASLLGFIYIFFILDVEQVKPYILLVMIFSLGLSGFRVWRSENID
jgi:VIT1/CCC1 family predicted Fe2+/Mn2+ transporter